MSRSLILIVGAALLLGAALGLRPDKASQAPAAKPPTRSSEAKLASPPTPASLEIAFKPQAGFRYTYGFERRIEIPRVTRLAYQGGLKLDVLRADGDGFDALARMEIAEQPAH